MSLVEGRALIIEDLDVTMPVLTLRSVGKHQFVRLLDKIVKHGVRYRIERIDQEPILGMHPIRLTLGECQVLNFLVNPLTG